MAVVYGMTLACKLDMVKGVHQPGDAYMLALYGVQATLNQFTEEYTREAEVKGQGYTAGGQALSGYNAVIDGARAELGWDTDVTWKVATIRARHALIYNKSKGNRALAVLDLGQDCASTNGPFVLTLPRAVIWIG